MSVVSNTTTISSPRLTPTSSSSKGLYLPDEAEPLLIVENVDGHPTAKGWWQSIHFTRWQSFAGVCLYVSMAGTTYAFGVYSELLRTNLGFSQGGIDVVASVGNTGLYLSIIGGLILERYGLQFVVYLGGLLIFIGFFYIWLAVEGYVPADIFSVSIFFFISQFGVCCHVSSAVTTSVRIFPSESRGSAVGLVKGYFGLSSAVLSDFSGGYFSHAKSYFILFIAITIPAVGVIGSTLANFMPPHTISFDFDRRKGISTSLIPFFAHWMSMFAVLFVVGYTQYAFDFPGWSSLLMPTILSFLLLSILLIPGYYGSRLLTEEEWKGPSEGGTDGGAVPDGYLTGPEDALREAEKDALEYLGEPADHSRGRKGTNDSNSTQSGLEQGSPGFSRTGGSFGEGGPPGRPSTGPRGSPEPSRRSDAHLSSPNSYGSLDHQTTNRNMGDQHIGIATKGHHIIDSTTDPPPECFYGESSHLSQSLQTWRFWTLYISFLTICGTGLMVIDNINAIADAYRMHPSDFYVSLVSLANGAGRVSAGFASDMLSRYFSRLELLAGVAAVMGVAQSMFAVGSTELLYPSLLLVGFLFGSSVSLVAINTADIFGPRYVATNFGAVDSAPIFGSYLFVTAVVALFYKTNVTDEVTGTAYCVGAQCFRGAFTTNACCCFLVSFLLAYMNYHTPMRPVLRRNDGH